MASSSVLSSVSAGAALGWEQGVWRADELATAAGEVCATGHAALDAELPGGGWPVGALTEVLQPRPTTAVWTLLLPALARAAASGARVALIAPPLAPFLPALAAGGLPPQALLWVDAPHTPDRLWACEQALRCAGVAAVLAWLPQVRSAQLRRLQLAAARQRSLLFVLRPAAAAQDASPARLRVLLAGRAAPVGAVGATGSASVRERDRASELGSVLAVHLIKRRGPPAEQPVTLPGQTPTLALLLAAAHRRRQAAVAPSMAPIAFRPAGPAPIAVRGAEPNPVPRWAPDAVPNAIGSGQVLTWPGARPTPQAGRPTSAGLFAPTPPAPPQAFLPSTAQAAHAMDRAALAAC